MGGSGQSKLSKVEKYLDKNDEKSLIHFLQSNKLPADYKIKCCGGKSSDKQCHFEEDLYILHYAAVNCSPTILQYLLLNQFQSLIDQKTPRKKTPLMYAVKFQRVDQIDLLHKSGAEVNVTDENGDSALHFACRIGNVDVVKALLVFQNVRLDIRNKYQNMAGDDAEYLNFTVIVEELRRHLHRSSTADSGINVRGPSCSSWNNTITLTDMSHTEQRVSERNGSLDGAIAEASNVQDRADFYLPEGERRLSEDHSGNVTHISEGHVQLGGSSTEIKDGLLDEKYQIQIRCNYNNIKLHLMVDEVLPVMFSKGHLARPVFDKINSHPHCSAKIKELIDILFTFTNQRFEEFLQILEETNQQALANEIRQTVVTTETSHKASFKESSQVVLRKQSKRNLSKRELAHSMAHLHTLTDDSSFPYGNSGLEEKYAEF